jgi:hypothetical protein
MESFFLEINSKRKDVVELDVGDENSGEMMLDELLAESLIQGNEFDQAAEEDWNEEDQMKFLGCKP